jgi:hypothetical protein
VTTTSSAKGPKVPYSCSFCGKSQEKVRKLIAGQGVYISDESNNLSQENIAEEMLEAPKQRPAASKLPNPRQIKFALDQYVISQERAKKVLSVAVYNLQGSSLIAAAHDAGLSGGEGSSVTEPAEAGTPEAEQQQKKSKS